jgi:hypothetical protein
METWETEIDGGNDSTSKNFHQWSAEVLKIRDMAQYKLFKLWKLNFTPADIAANKHHVIYPPDRATRRRTALGRTEEQKRGKKLSAKKKQWLYARALRDMAEAVLAFHSMEQAMIDETRKELEGFKELMKKFAHKQK